MRKRILFVAVIAMLAALGACEKSSVECKLVPAKIIRYDCDRVIFQILSNELIGDASWEDVQTGERYTNIVSYYNICKIAETAHGEKCTLYVRIKKDTKEYHDLACITCKAISPAPPKTKVDFAEILTLPCPPTSGN